MKLRITTWLGMFAVVLLLTACGGGAVIEDQADEPVGPSLQDDAHEPDTDDDSAGSATDEGSDELEPEEPQPVTNLDRIEPVYIPYVEDVIIPDTIIAGQPFEVTLKLSAALKPELLNGISSEYVLPRSQFSGDNSIGLAIHLWDNPTDFDPVFEHSVQIHQNLVRPEMDALQVNTADSPEWGGLEVMMNTTQGQFYPHEHLVWREYPINVVPAEE